MKVKYRIILFLMTYGLSGYASEERKKLVQKHIDECHEVYSKLKREWLKQEQQKKFSTRLSKAMRSIQQRVSHGSFYPKKTSIKNFSFSRILCYPACTVMGLGILSFSSTGKKLFGYR